MSENPTGKGLLVLDLQRLTLQTQLELDALRVAGLGIDLVTRVSVGNLLQFSDNEHYEIPASIEFAIANPDQYETLLNLLNHYTTTLRDLVQRTGIGLQNVEGLHGWMGCSVILNVNNNF